MTFGFVDEQLGDRKAVRQAESRPAARYRAPACAPVRALPREAPSQETPDRGDYERIAGFHDPHIVVISLEDGALYGNNAVLANYERWNEAWEANETTLEEVIGRGDRVFVTVRFHGRGRASGVEVETRFYEVYTLRDGKVLRIDE